MYRKWPGEASMEGKRQEISDKSKNKTLKWKVKGGVVSRGLSQPGTQDCTHPTLMKDMCAECGADLRENPGHAGARKEAVSASVAMVHSIPELIVSEEEALRIGKSDEERLLKTRKLVLLVDLDQTLIHTTNDNIPANLKGVFHFQLAHGNAVLWYHTRLRPHTEEFLKKISTMYELHICTFGVRLYAHTIANFLDPEGKYFSHRILSRDECFSSNSKMPNLKALFPCGDSMVCIIDDREDVWNFSPNLINVKPYRFFQGTADINAPPGCQKTESDLNPVKHRVRRISHSSDGSSQVVEINSKLPSEGEIQVEEKDSQSKEGQKQSEIKPDKAADVKCGQKENTDCVKMTNSCGEGGIDTKSDACESEAKSPESAGKREVETISEEIEWVDDDDYLLHLEEILRRVHKAFYDVYDQMTQKGDVEKVPDMKSIIPYVKKKVLKGANVLFSGVFPTNMPPEKSRAHIVAKSLGASIHTNFVPKSAQEGKNGNNTTHVIAARLGTSKVRAAQKSGSVYLVTPEWLWTCGDRWEHVDERLFPLTEESQATLPMKPDLPSQPPMVKEAVKRKSDTSVEEVYVYDRVTGKRCKTETLQGGRQTESDTPPDIKAAKGDGDFLSGEQDCIEDFPQNVEEQESKFADSFNPLYSLSDEEIATMDREVEELMEDEDSSDDEGEDENTKKNEETLRRKVLGSCLPQESSSEDSLSADFPRGWQAKKKLQKIGKLRSCGVGMGELDTDKEDEGDEQDDIMDVSRNAGDESDDSENSEKSYESVGSVDDEIALAVEKEFLS